MSESRRRRAPRSDRPRVRRVVVAAAFTALTVAPGLVGTTAITTTSAAATAAVVLPPRHARVDYQLGGAYPLPPGVRVVSRDRTAEPAKGAYSICYVNGFQAQPGELAWWKREHPELLLRTASGALVVDDGWGEALLDLRTAAKRSALATVMRGWFAGCARDGFAAVEPDNLDSWTRSKHLLTRDHAVAYARLLTAAAHARGLAIAQKNAAGLASAGPGIGFDFAVAEECTRYDECDAYATAYRDRVLVIEYRAADLTRACGDPAIGGRLSVVLRDRALRPLGAKGYVYRHC